MDRLGALLSTLGAKLALPISLKSVFLETPCISGLKFQKSLYVSKLKNAITQHKGSKELAGQLKA